MKHVHIDKAIGGTNDGRVTPYVGGNRPVLSLIKRGQFSSVYDFVDRHGPSINDRLEIELYHLEIFHADGVDITFWVEESLSPAAAICQLLLRYVPREDLTELRR